MYIDLVKKCPTVNRDIGGSVQSQLAIQSQEAVWSKRKQKHHKSA